MKILITLPVSLGAPGGGTNDCFQLARHMARAGARVRVLHTQSLGPGRFPRLVPDASLDGSERVALLAEDGVEARAVPAHPLIYLLDGRPMRAAVRRALDEEPADVLLGWGHETMFLAEDLRRRGVLHAMNAAASYAPMFLWQGMRSSWPRRWRNERVLARPLRRAQVVFARSVFTRGELVELVGVDPARIRVVHCGVDPAFARIERVDDEGPIERLLYVGPLSEAKGLFATLEALGRVVRDGRTGWRLRIVGWGDAERVRAAAGEHGIAERIELLGRLEHPALRAELARAQLMIQPSASESFGLVNAEAQAAGVPVVAYAVSAVPEVVQEGVSGWLVPPGELAALAGAITAALDDPAGARERGRAGRERVSRLFTWERAAADTLQGLQAARKRPS